MKSQRVILTRWFVRPKQVDVIKHGCYCYEAQKAFIYLNYININIIMIQFRLYNRK